MFELGGNAESRHGEVGRDAVKRGIDVILCVGELAEQIAAEARAEIEKETLSGMTGSFGKSEVRHYAGKEELFRELERLIKAGDTVLVKASHGMGFAEIVDKLK